MQTKVKNTIRERMGVKESHSKYLGLSTIIGKSKKLIFPALQGKLWKKVKGWKERSLSQAGRRLC